MKKLLILGVIALLVFLIYINNQDKKVSFLALGDSLALGVTPYGSVDYSYNDYIKDYLKSKKVLEEYINGYASSGYRTVDLLRDIEDNKTINVNGKEKTIKNALIKADLVTISIGANDLLARLNYNTNFNNEIYEYIDEIISDTDILLSKIREYTKEDIILLGYYYPLKTTVDNVDEVFNYIYQNLETLCQKYNISFVETYDIFKDNPEYLPNPADIHPSKKGYKAIAEEMIAKVEELVFR